MKAIIYLALTNKGKFVFVDAIPVSGTYTEFEKYIDGREEAIEDILVWGALSKPTKPGLYLVTTEYCDCRHTAFTVLNCGTMAKIIDHE